MGKRARVVVVNDATAVLDLYADMLEELQYEPVVMATEAIETPKIRAAKPDAVILDLTVGLQTEYGIEMARQLRADEEYSAIPIVVATANADAIDGARQRLKEIGVPILLKPFSMEELAGCLVGAGQADDHPRRAASRSDSKKPPRPDGSRRPGNGIA